MPFDEERKSARQFVSKGAEALIRLSPLGGSGFVFISSLLKQKWLTAILMFPVMVATIFWASFTEGFLSKIQQASNQWGESAGNWFTKILEAIAWQLAGVEDKYLKCQANPCKDFTTEGHKPGLNIFTPLLNEVFVPLDLSNSFIRNILGESLPMPQGFKWDEKTIELLEKDGLRIWEILKQTDKIPAYKRLAVLAWGGYGKTTLLRHITYIYTYKKEKRYQAPKLLPVLLLL